MIFASVALAMQAMPAPPALSLEQSAALRCAAAFALTAEAQGRGDAAAGALPPLAGRGREYFVRVSARLIDELGLERQQLASLLQGQARQLAQEGNGATVARACLPMLDAAGL